MKTVRMRIEGMTCQSCANRVKGFLTKRKGVLWAEIDYLKGESVVRFDPKMVTETEIIGNSVFRKVFRVKGDDGKTYAHRYTASKL